MTRNIPQYIYNGTYAKEEFGKTLEILSKYHDGSSLLLYNKFKTKKWWGKVIINQEEKIIKEHIKLSHERIVAVVSEIAEKKSCLVIDLQESDIQLATDEYVDCSDFFINGTIPDTKRLNISLIFNTLDGTYKEKILSLKPKEDVGKNIIVESISTNNNHDNNENKEDQENNNSVTSRNNQDQLNNNPTTNTKGDNKKDGEGLGLNLQNPENNNNNVKIVDENNQLPQQKTLLDKTYTHKKKIISICLLSILFCYFFYRNK